MKWVWWALLKIQSGHDSVQSWTYVQTDKVKPVYPRFDFIETGKQILTVIWYHIILPAKTPWTKKADIQAVVETILARHISLFGVVQAACGATPEEWNAVIAYFKHP